MRSFARVKIFQIPLKSKLGQITHFLVLTIPEVVFIDCPIQINVFMFFCSKTFSALGFSAYCSASGQKIDFLFFLLIKSRRIHILTKQKQDDKNKGKQKHKLNNIDFFYFLICLFFPIRLKIAT